MLRPAPTLFAIAAIGVTAAAVDENVGAQQSRPTVAVAEKGGGKVTGKVTIVEDGKPVTADAIVYVTGFDEPGGSKTPKIEQKGRKFMPDLLAITVGDTVNFPNGDPYLHNVFSQSPPRKFDLGSYKQGESKDKDFEKAGVVDVYCNIHPEMAATILILPNKKHTRTDANGGFTIADVPPGDWTVYAYARRASKPVSAKIHVSANAETPVELTLTRGADTAHVNKYGEKYHDAGGTYR